MDASIFVIDLPLTGHPTIGLGDPQRPGGKKAVMTAHRLIYCLLIFLIVLLCGCNITISLNDGAIADGKTSVLPDPEQPNGNGDEPVPLDEAQQARKQEVDQYIATVIYQGATITQAIQLPSGDIIDGLDRDTLPALPYALSALPWTPDALQLPPGVEFGLADFEEHAELADLVASRTGTRGAT
jgi:hypothetical protein